MATYSDNKSIFVDVGISNSGNYLNSATNPVMYTCPANCYAIVSLYVKNDGNITETSFNFTIGGVNFLGWDFGRDNGGQQLRSPQVFSQLLKKDVYVGPGQTVVAVIAAGNGSGTWRIQGVQFKNSP